MKGLRKRAKNVLTLQQDGADCGVAALRTIIRWHGADVPSEELRVASGAMPGGTTLLGLYQAAGKYHLEAEAYQMDLSDLGKQDEPCILHVLIDQKHLHYVVFFGFDQDGLAVVGDPSAGLRLLSKENLVQIWVSKTALLLSPGKNFPRLSKGKTVSTFQWIFASIEENKPYLTISIAIGVLVSVLSLSTSIFFQKLIDQLLPNDQKELVVGGLVLLFVILVARSLLGYLRQFALFKFSKNYNEKITLEFLERFLGLPKSFYDSRKTGDLIARINDTQKIQDNINFVAGNVVIDGLIILVSLSVLFVYSLPIGMLMLFFIPVAGYIMYSYTSKLSDGQKRVMEEYANVENYYINTLSGLDTINECGKSRHFLGIGTHFFSKYQESVFKLSQTGNRLGLRVELLIGLQTVITIGCASFIFYRGNLTIGEMVACLSILTNAIPSILRVGQVNLHLQEIDISLKRILEVAGSKPLEEHGVKTALDKEDKLKNIDINNVSFAYAGRQPLFSEVNLQINAGECVAVLGPNGCGKSTFLKLLSGLYPVSSGVISISTQNNRHNIRDIKLNEIFATVPQNIYVFHGNIYDNIVLEANENMQMFELFMRKYGFDSYFGSFPMGYLTPISEDAVKPSGGQLQILALARALYTNPSVLLLDECTSSLDEQSRNFMLSVLKHWRKNESKTIVLVSHDERLLKIADKQFYLGNRHVEIVNP